MATNTEFKKVMIKSVALLWPRLDQPYRYNSQEKKTEACAATVQGAGWSVGWSMSAEDAKALREELRAHYEAQREVNRKLPEFKRIFGANKQDDGSVQFTAKKRAVSNAGKQNKPPAVVGRDLKDLEEKNIWSGSIANIRVLAFPTTDPDGDGGISLLLDVVQVIEAKYGGDGLEGDFEIVDDDPAEGLENLETDQPRTAAQAADTSASKAQLADAEW